MKPYHVQVLQILAIAFGVLLFLFGLNPSFAFAREMQGRLGLGYNSQFAQSYTSGARVPGVSFKYGMSRDTAVEAIFGIATTSPISSVAAMKLFKNIFYEQNLNFYFMAGAGLISLNSTSGVQVISGFGAEFFIPGVESLGFSVETGASFDNASGSYALRTLGVSFLDAGIHFYF